MHWLTLSIQLPKLMNPYGAPLLSLLLSTGLPSSGPGGPRPLFLPLLSRLPILPPLPRSSRSSLLSIVTHVASRGSHVAVPHRMRHRRTRWRTWGSSVVPLHVVSTVMHGRQRRPTVHMVWWPGNVEEVVLHYDARHPLKALMGAEGGLECLYARLDP